MNEYPLVTIITPSYNQGRFIEETILSVLNQDYPNIEYMVMDGGSTDNTLEILKKYSNRIIWFSENDKGQSDAINKGFRLAKGEVIAWLNSDDTYLTGAIRKAVDYLYNINPDAKFVYGEGYHVSENGEILERYPTEPFSYSHLAETCYICQPTTFWKKEIFKTVGFLNTDLQFAMDYDYWIRIAKQYKNLYHTDDFFANSRMYPENKTLSKRVEVHAEFLNIIKNHYGKVPASWVYAYGHVVLDNKIKRDNKIKNLVFVLGLTCIATYKFLQYNKSISCSEFGLWKKWFMDALVKYRS